MPITLTSRRKFLAGSAGALTLGQVCGPLVGAKEGRWTV